MIVDFRMSDYSYQRFDKEIDGESTQIASIIEKVRGWGNSPVQPRRIKTAIGGKRIQTRRRRQSHMFQVID